MAGWYGVLRICFIPFLAVNSANSLDMNCGPLSGNTCVFVLATHMLKAPVAKSQLFSELLCWASQHFQATLVIGFSQVLHAMSFFYRWPPRHVPLLIPSFCVCQDGFDVILAKEYVQSNFKCIRKNQVQL